MEREVVRIDISIPMVAYPISKEEWEKKSARVVGDMPIFSYIPLKDTLDEALNNWLKLINAKLDYLINLLTCEKEGFTGLPYQRVNFSEKGIRFLYSSPLEKGQIMEVKLVLDLYQNLGFYLYGEVVRCEKKDDQYEVALEWLPMPLDIREKISFYILHKQREIIREKKGL
ncbi:MAG: PilZ domain-containing protein [Caldimicrobium sp.]|nr:PilZ domain-containing protein [Caldimicrobium sp.]MCX7873263.1 PilZ domain-containing protein [Caldimicrobium sp.]MDW8094719.1 PilZ domain-containing protein [Caldimicrobium sp.]